MISCSFSSAGESRFSILQQTSVSDISKAYSSFVMFSIWFYISCVSFSSFYYYFSHNLCCFVFISVYYVVLLLWQC